jgi:hypothetical protein
MTLRALIFPSLLSLAVFHSTACAGGRMAPRSAAQVAFDGQSNGGGAASSQSAITTGSDTALTAIPEQLVIEGTLRVEVDKIVDLVDALRTQVNTAGGRVVLESVNGAETSWSATLKLRLPPSSVDAVVTWLGQRGTIVEKLITANDVSKELFDQELEITNQQAALDRLTKLMEQGGLSMADILSVEKEMSRIRGRIDELKGATRFTKDRVGFATLNVYLSRASGAVHVAKAKAYPGVRMTMLTLLGAGDRQQTRFGAGLVIHPVLRSFSLEVDIFASTKDQTSDQGARAVLASIGGAFYSDYLGRGERSFLNPYIGFRGGYAYFDGSRFLSQFEAGVELLKTKHFMVDANVRATAMVGNSSDLAVVSGFGAVAAF